MSEFKYEKAKTACFTGHRSEKLPGDGDCKTSVMGVVKSLIYQEISDSIEEGYKSFITGLARGIDLIAGELVLDLKRSGRDISLVAVIPYRGQPVRTRGYEKFVYGCILNEADDIICLSEKYYNGCMQRRNKFMIEHSSRVIAVVKDYKSGTGQTIRLAEKAGLDIKTVDIKKIEAASETAKSFGKNITVL